VLVNSLLRAPGNRTLSGLVLNRSWSHRQTILLSTRRRRNTPRPSGRALHDGSRAIDGRGRSKAQGPQPARGIAERHFAECRFYIAVRGLRCYRIRGRQVKATASFGSRGSRPTPDETGADSSSRMTRDRHVLRMQPQNNCTRRRRIGLQCNASPKRRAPHVGVGPSRREAPKSIFLSAHVPARIDKVAPRTKSCHHYHSLFPAPLPPTGPPKCSLREYASANCSQRASAGSRATPHRDASPPLPAARSSRHPREARRRLRRRLRNLQSRRARRTLASRRLLRRSRSSEVRYLFVSPLRETPTLTHAQSAPSSRPSPRRTTR
jgi:hypothetical protein